MSVCQNGQHGMGYIVQIPLLLNTYAMLRGYVHHFASFHPSPRTVLTGETILYWNIYCHISQSVWSTLDS